MGIDLDYYRRINGMEDIPDKNGNEANSEIIDRMSRILKDTNEKIVHSFDLYKRQGLLIEAEKQRYETKTFEDVHIFYKKVKEPTLNSLVRGIYADLNTIKAGDYITYTDKHSHVRETYIVRSKSEPKRTYEEAYLMFCNDRLRWINKTTKEIKDYPCVMSHDKYIIDNRDEGMFERESSWVVVYAQSNPDTLRLQTNDRFIVKAEADDIYSAYEILDSNPHSINGLIVFKIRKVKVNQIDDNFTLGIANYYSIMGDEQPVVDENDITGDTELLIGDTNIYSYEVPNLNDYEWSLVHVEGDISINGYLLHTTDESNNLHINAVVSAKSSGSKFDIILSDSNGIEVARKRIEVTGW